MDKFEVKIFAWGYENGWQKTKSSWEAFSTLPEALQLLEDFHKMILDLEDKEDSHVSNVSEISVGGDGLSSFLYDYDYVPHLAQIVRIKEEIKMDKALSGIALKVTVLDDVDIEDAYNQIKILSERLGGVQIETSFNGVRMLYSGQSEGVWEAQYARGATQD